MKGSKGKSPSIQWYYKDWLSDKNLRRCHASTKGIWMDILMYMLDCSDDKNNCNDGSLEYLTPRQIMALSGCTEEEAWTFIDDAFDHKFCEIEADKQRTFHIMSRRISRDQKQRERWRKQKKYQRNNNDVHKGVHQSSKNSPSITPTPTPSPTSNEDVKNNKKFQKKNNRHSTERKTFQDQVRSFFESIKTHCDQISKLPKKDGKPFHPKSFVDDFVSQQKHPGAINEALKALVSHWPDVEDPYAYARAVIKTQNGNYNEKESIAFHESLKKLPPADIPELTNGIMTDI